MELTAQNPATDLTLKDQEATPEERAHLLVTGWHGWYFKRSTRLITEEEQEAIRGQVFQLIYGMGFQDSTLKMILAIWSGMIQSTAPLNFSLLHTVAWRYRQDTSAAGRRWAADARAAVHAWQPIMRQASLAAPARALQAA